MPAPKMFTSASFLTTFKGTRAEAIQQVKAFFVGRSQQYKDSGRWTWRAHDDSGFTVSVENGIVKSVSKWNKARGA